LYVSHLRKFPSLRTPQVPNVRTADSQNGSRSPAERPAAPAGGDWVQSSPTMSSSQILAPVRDDMEQMAENLRNIVGNRNPLLLAAAEQIFGAGGKKLRPAIVFLVARATAELSGLRYPPPPPAGTSKLN